MPLRSGRLSARRRDPKHKRRPRFSDAPAGFARRRCQLALILVPIYEFRCPNGHLFEAFHLMADPDPETCEVCDAGPLTKVLHPVPVHFKGSGFYSTDYGRGGRKRDSSDSSPADGGASKDVKKVEKKDEKKPEKKAAAGEN